MDEEDAERLIQETGYNTVERIRQLISYIIDPGDYTTDVQSFATARLRALGLDEYGLPIEKPGETT